MCLTIAISFFLLAACRVGVQQSLNYRPVSILCIVSKILERAIYIQLEQYIKENDILYELQSDFRGMYSTETCLIHLTDHIRIQMAKGNYTGMVLLDLQKEFDTVDKNILCIKMEAMGIGSTTWFRSYFNGKTQKVKIGDSFQIHAHHMWSAAGKRPRPITVFMLCKRYAS